MTAKAPASRLNKGLLAVALIGGFVAGALLSLLFARAQLSSCNMQEDGLEAIKTLLELRRQPLSSGQKTRELLVNGSFAGRLRSERP